MSRDTENQPNTIQAIVNLGIQKRIQLDVANGYRLASQQISGDSPHPNTLQTSNNTAYQFLILLYAGIPTNIGIPLDSQTIIAIQALRRWGYAYVRWTVNELPIDQVYPDFSGATFKIKLARNPWWAYLIQSVAYILALTPLLLLEEILFLGLQPGTPRTAAMLAVLALYLILLRKPIVILINAVRIMVSKMATPFYTNDNRPKSHQM